jgi:hypothetical protein
MATDMVDLASVATDSAATTDTSSTEVSTTTPTSGSDDLQIIDSSSETHEEDSTEGAETELKNSDGSDKSPEQQKAFKEAAAAKGGVDASIVEQRSALKALKELDGGKYAKAVASLHGAAERWAATKELLSNGPDGGINGLKQYFQALGVKDLPSAVENLRSTNSMIEAVKGSDELLYAADPQLSDNVYEDMKAQGKEGAYGKVVGNFLDHLREMDSSAYYEISKSHTLNAMQESGLPDAINSIHQALASGDTNKAKAVLKNVADWYLGLREETSEKSKISKEREAWEAEKAEGSKAETAKATKEYETTVATDAEHSNNKILGAALAPFFRLPFFKDFPRDTKIDLGNGIKDRLYSTLKADKAYQIQMAAMWKSKPTPENKAKILQYHNATLERISAEVVRSTIQNRYPGYARGGSAAGRAASATANKTAATKAATQSIENMRPIYVASRPTNLVRDSVKVGGKTFDTNQLQVLQIGGKGFTRGANGQLRFVTWRK